MTDEQVEHRIDPGRLFAGVMMIGLGVLFLLDRFDVADFSDVIRHYWPMFIIAIGLSKVMRRGTVWPGLWLITLGTWLQLVTLRLFGLTYGNSWPVLLVALGGGMIVRTLFESARSRREPNAP
jgi:hypothetical protein